MRVMLAIAALVAGCMYDGRPLVGADGAPASIDAAPTADPDGSAVSAIDAAPGTPDAIVVGAPDATPPGIDAAPACPEELSATCVPGGTCSDGADNDGDGATDCNDSGCSGVCGLSVCCPDGSCADLLIFCP